MIPLDQWTQAARPFEHGGFRLHYHEAGDGPPLVLIHGFPTCSWDWQALWPSLTARYRCIALDMLGFGLSDKPKDHVYSLLEQADFHEALLCKLGITEAHFIAHDYGDSVLQELLARQQRGEHKVTVLSAYMLNGGIIPGQHRPRFMQRILSSPLGRFVGPLINERGFRRSLSEVFGPNTQPSDEELAGWWKQMQHNGGKLVMYRLIRYMQERRDNYDRWVGVLAVSPAPLRFYAGALDPVSGQHMAEAFLALGPNQDGGILQGIGHYPQTEAPDEVLADYGDFRSRILEAKA